MTTKTRPLTTGYCTVCRQLGSGRLLMTLDERHELIDEHADCPGPPAESERPRRYSRPDRKARP